MTRKTKISAHLKQMNFKLSFSSTVFSILTSLIKEDAYEKKPGNFHKIFACCACSVESISAAQFNLILFFTVSETSCFGCIKQIV